MHTNTFQCPRRHKVNIRCPSQGCLILLGVFLALRVLTEFDTRLSIFLALPDHLDIGWSTLTHHFVVEKHPVKNTQTALYL